MESSTQPMQPTQPEEPSDARPPGNRARRWLVAWIVVLVAILSVFAFQVPPREPLDVFDTGHRPAVVAHGGAQGHAPGNTIEAFEIAVDQGADVLEMDVQLTADDDIVVFHDGHLEDKTDGQGPVVEHTVAELQALDGGYHWRDVDGETSARGQGIRIPTLREVVEAFPDEILNVELKPDGGIGVVEPALEILTELDALDRVVVASFDQEVLDRFRELAPGVPTAMTEDEIRTFYILHLAGLHGWWDAPGDVFQVPEYSGDTHVVTRRFTRAAERVGIDVQVWTVNEVEDMHRILDAGAHAIMTDFPDRLVEVIEEREARPADERLALAERLQDRFRWAEGILLVATFLGDVEFYLAFMPLLYWSVHPGIGIRFGLVLLISSGLNEVFKLVWPSPRPSFLVPDLGVVQEHSLAIPSGHAQNGMAVWGALAASIRRWWAWIAAAVLVALIGYSRLQLGAHFVVDLVIGWVIGALLLIAFLLAERPVGQWLARRTPTDQLLAVFAASLTIAVLGVAVASRLAGFAAPFDWVGVVDMEELTGASRAIRSAGALFGAGAGIVLVRHLGGYDAGGSIGQRVGRYALGVVVVGLLFFGLGAVLPGGTGAVGETLRFVRYGLIGAWITGGAPWLFMRVGLAGRPRTATGAGRSTADAAG